LKRFGAIFGRFGAILGRFGAVLGRFGAILGRLDVIIETFRTLGAPIVPIPGSSNM